MLEDYKKKKREIRTFVAYLTLLAFELANSKR